MEEPTEELVAAAFGKEVLTRLLTGNEGVIDCSLAAEKIGHVSVHSWRAYRVERGSCSEEKAERSEE
jgi:hypothetical protein